MKNRKIILFELNEVPSRIIDYYCNTYQHSSLAKLLNQSRQYETYAEEPGELSPTKTWPTVHRGVNYDKHGIESFGQPLDEVDLEFPPLWRLTAAHGVKTGVFGSLLTHQMPKDLDNYSFYLPEAFAKDSYAYPAYLSLFQEFNLVMSRASTRNVSQKVDWNSGLQFILNSPELGVSLKSFIDIVKQLVSEKLNPNVKTRRRTFQSILGFDIFMKQLQTSQPGFVTFFTNHVAATMHRYWAAMFPGDYDNFHLQNEWVMAHQEEIDFAMQKTDAMLAQLLKFVDANPKYLLYVVTSMGQAATTAKAIESFLTIAELPKFMAHLGVNQAEYEQRPTMAPHYSVVISPHKLDEFRTRSSTLSMNGKNMDFREREGGFFHIDFMYQDYQGTSYVELNGSRISFEDMGIAKTCHEDGVYLTANHIPQGVMLIYDPQCKVRNKQPIKISTLDIAPTILSNFSIPIPDYMNQPIDLVSV